MAGRSFVQRGIKVCEKSTLQLVKETGENGSTSVPTHCPTQYRSQRNAQGKGAVTVLINVTVTT